MPGKWHTEWQSYFDNREETIHNDRFTTISKTRRADVLLSNYAIEFQHSQISITEIQARKRDWGCVGKKIIWVINGNDTCKVNVKNKNTCIVTVELGWWKANNFKCYDIIFFDIDEKIYIIEPNHIISHAVQTTMPINKDEFITMLKQDNMKMIDELNSKYIDHRPTIHIKQEGAGNGKTYGVIQLLENVDYIHYEIFIYLTKQHSAVNVIRQELNDQIKRGELSNIRIVHDNIDNKKHIIIYKNMKTEKECKIIIGTIDSFKWALGDKSITGIDKFRTIVNDIIENDIRTGKDGYLQYTATGVKLNMKTLIVGDEMQDLHPEYTKALVKISIEKCVDFYAVGDKLQSISNEKNAFTYLTDELKDTDNIRLEKHEPKNICRRFDDTKLVNFVNSCVPFSKYKLPAIKVELKESTNNSLEFFEGKWVNPNKPLQDDINKEADKIMEKYIHEVDNNDRKPNDFLIVTPFVSKNPLLDEINTKIRDFWKDKYNDHDNYNQYSIFHKSEQGTSIDLKQSENSTRIVSIHSSKGDGRPVVFVIGLTESALLKWTPNNDSLIFNSLLHVAITRQKEKLYIRYEQKGDKINELINKYCETDETQYLKPIFNKSKHIRFSDLISYNKEENFKSIYEQIIDKTNLEELTESVSGPKMLIDMQHHCIRYNTFSILIRLHLLSDSIKTNDEKRYDEPIHEVLRKIQNIKIEETTTCEYYNYLRNHYPQQKKIFPIIKYEKGKYKEYYTLLRNKISNVKKFIDTFLKTGIINDDIEWIDMVCLYYLMDVLDNGLYGNVSVDDMYDIIHIYKNQTVEEKKIFMQNHYEKIRQTKEVVERFIKINPNLKYLLHHKVYYHGNNKDYSIYNRFELIGYNEKEVILLEIKPQFNSLNYHDVLYDSIFRSFLINSSNDKRFENKSIKTFVLTYDNNYIPYCIYWGNMNNKNEKNIMKIFKSNMITHFEMEHNKIYNFFMYYYYSVSKDQTFMKKVLNEYKNKDNEKYCYEYVLQLFMDIKRQLKRNKEPSYFNKEYFVENLLENLEDSMEEFFD